MYNGITSAISSLFSSHPNVRQQTEKIFPDRADFERMVGETMDQLAQQQVQPDPVIAPVLAPVPVQHDEQQRPPSPLDPSSNFGSDISPGTLLLDSDVEEAGVEGAGNGGGRNASPQPLDQVAILQHRATDLEIALINSNKARRDAEESFKEIDNHLQLTQDALAIALADAQKSNLQVDSLKRECKDLKDRLRQEKRDGKKPEASAEPNANIDPAVLARLRAANPVRRPADLASVSSGIFASPCASPRQDPVITPVPNQKREGLCPYRFKTGPLCTTPANSPQLFDGVRYCVRHCADLIQADDKKKADELKNVVKLKDFVAKRKDRGNEVHDYWMATARSASTNSDEACARAEERAREADEFINGACADYSSDRSSSSASSSDSPPKRARSENPRR